MGLSALGIFHTLIGIAAIVSAVSAYVKYGKIDLGKGTGKIYFYGTLITSLTALGLSSVRGVNPGHILAVLVIVLIGVAYYLFARRKHSPRARYTENFFLSFSFFLSLIPTVNETFTRVPVGSPLADGPAHPLITNTLLALFLLFAGGSVVQFRKQRKDNRAA